MDLGLLDDGVSGLWDFGIGLFWIVDLGVFGIVMLGFLDLAIQVLGFTDCLFPGVLDL